MYIYIYIYIYIYTLEYLNALNAEFELLTLTLMLE